MEPPAPAGRQKEIPALTGLVVEDLLEFSKILDILPGLMDPGVIGIGGEKWILPGVGNLEERYLIHGFPFHGQSIQSERTPASSPRIRASSASAA